ncbi:hypothetical protein ACIGBN_14215 [Marinomonas sp. NPDC078689]|uniref:hypothetical protein n=1 Tax=Marinomonas sp. NPDC078689 TaxID=3364147 RepID=UPI0037C56A8D
MAFNIEDEISLAHLYGNKSEDIKVFNGDEKKLVGFLGQSIYFLKYVFLNFSLKFQSLERREVFFYSETNNQFDSLKSTVRSLDDMSISNVVFLDKRIDSDRVKEIGSHRVVKFDFFIVLFAMLLFFLRSVPLYLKLKRSGKVVAIRSHFGIFCRAYLYVPYFMKVLLLSRPKLIVMTNDHNVSNRSLRLAAEVLGIKTLYMQHASVSNLFPPLEFDYALLDGQVSLDRYNECFDMAKEKPLRLLRNIRKCHVLLSGQKKTIEKRKGSNERAVGIAVNKLDDFKNVEELVFKLIRFGKDCFIRTHPSQPSKFIDKIKKMSEENINVFFSDSRIEDLTEYFLKINSLISGDSSIHIEAALTGMPTFYYEMSDDIYQSDYYGYVKNGVSYYLDYGFELKDLDLKENDARSFSIKRYSESYNTKWQNREGVLSALVIFRILDGEDFFDFFTCIENNLYQSVAYLK